MLMERKVELLLAAGVIVVLAGGCATARPTNAPAGIDLRGSWVIDTAASGGPGLRQRTGQGQPGEPGFGGRGGRGGVGRPGGGFGGGFGGGMRGRGGGRGTGGQFDPKRMAQMREALRALMPSASQVKVLEADTLVRLEWGDGRPMAVATNGKKQERDWGDVRVALKAKWSDGALHVERSANGVTVAESWMRNPGTQRLTVDVKVSGAGPRAMQFERVYNLEDAGS